MEKTVCELFAGVGGFRLGLEKDSSDWKTVWFSQWEPGKKNQWAHDCYVQHWGDIDRYTGIDISLVDKWKIPSHSLLVGGFPCQDYSVARPLPGSSGIEGKKGVLWWQIRDVLRAKNTPFGLFENVDRLLKSPASQRGRDFGVMLACLNDMGYSAEWRVVNAADYGGPQRRRRTFIFAYRNDTDYAKSLKETSADDILRTKGLFAHAFPVEALLKPISTNIAGKEVIDISDEFSFEFKKAGFMRDGVIDTADITPIYEPPILLKDILQKDVDEKYYIDDEEQLAKWEYLKGSKKIERTARNGHKYTFSEGAIAFPDNLDAPARTMLTSEGTTNRSSHIVRDPQTDRMRILTPVETERIQGFEDDWTNSGMPERFRYFCMGNALVVPMITRMAKVLGPIIEVETLD